LKVERKLLKEEEFFMAIIKSKMKTKIDKYFERYDQIRVKPEYAFGLAQGFVSELQSLDPELRFELLSLFKKIDEDAFNNGIEIPNLDYQLVEDELKIWKELQKSPPKKKKERKIEVIDDFNKVLFDFFSKYESFFLKIKGYFAFKLENTNDTKTKVIVLYDENYNKHPEIDLFDVKDVNLDIKKYQLQEFMELAKKTEVTNENFLCILLIASNLRNNEEVIPKINDLISTFSNSHYISIRKIPLTVIDDYEIKESAEGIESIKSYSDKLFNNRALSFEEELIIKKLFEGSEMILDYKFLKSGNSGSKVIEIHPLRANHPIMGRFVVKFDMKNSERKIQKEKKLFKENISDLLVPHYTIEYEETITHEAIRYNYASSDSQKDSFPFSKLINDYIKGKYEYPFTLNNVIDQLFECDPYKIWNSRIYTVTELVANLYRDYLKSEDRIFKNIALIKGIDNGIVSEVDLVKNYKLIKEYQLKTNKKICHGDLHSENFFKDEKGVYLIDFGWTNKHHSVIDYATLECSIKYKHLPFYIPIDELMNYESELLHIDSFSNDFKLSFIERPIAFNLFKLIIQIREKAKEHMLVKTSNLEYLISLFIINFRQIQYSELNQAYAYHSAELLSKKIVELIKS